MIAGADGCKAGWLVAVGAGWPCQETPRLYVCRDFCSVLDLTQGCESVVVDIPIGLPNGNGERLCDIEARTMLGKSGRSRVFLAPPRESLNAKTPEEFQATHKRLRGVGAGLPVWGIVPKLREVDAAMTPRLQERVREFHPELTWARLAKGTVASKHRPEGIAQRKAILEPCVPSLGSIAKWQESLGRAAQLDDVLDALVGLAVAEDIQKGSNPLSRLPAENPPQDAGGLRMEIWY